MIKIKVFSNFADSKGCKKCFEGILNYTIPHHYGNNKTFVLTEEDNYNCAIILNTAMPTLTIEKEKVIGFAFEPYEFLRINKTFIEYAKKHIGKYYIGDKRDLHDPFVEGIGYMWHGNPHRSLTNKPNIMSIVLSSKKQATGHKYRHQLVQKIVELCLPIDIYGTGANNYKGQTIKGPFKSYEPYEEYMFTIAIENYKNNDYISEKFLTPLMFNCMPIYWGANNIFKYVTTDETILLTQNIDQDIDILKKILTSPNDYYRKTYNKKNIKTFNLLLNIPEVFGFKHVKPYDINDDEINNK